MPTPSPPKVILFTPVTTLFRNEWYYIYYNCFFVKFVFQIYYNDVPAHIYKRLICYSEKLSRNPEPIIRLIHILYPGRFYKWIFVPRTAL